MIIFINYSTFFHFIIKQTNTEHVVDEISVLKINQVHRLFTVSFHYLKHFNIDAVL